MSKSPWSRRSFLHASAALGVAALAGCRSSQLQSRSGAATPTDAGTSAGLPLAIDMHNHVYPVGTEPHPQHGGSGRTPAPTLSLSEELARSGLTAVCTSFVLDFARNEKPGDARENFLAWLSAIDAELAKSGVRRALTLGDLETAHRDRKPVLIQTVEGAHFIEGRIDRVDEVYARGLRHLQLLHDKDDLVTPLGDTNTGVAHLGGLTAFGAEVVKRCNRLGVVVDVAHANAETVRGALRVATQPVVVSHTNLDTWTGSNARMAEMMRPRLISKEHAKDVADAGGVVGVWTHLTSSLAEFVGSIKAMADAIGVDHVGVGTDTDLLSARTGQGTNLAWPGLDTGFFPAVVAEMQRQGFSADDIAKIAGGNYARVFGQVTANHA